jgi:hypothetical protein
MIKYIEKHNSQKHSMKYSYYARRAFLNMKKVHDFVTYDEGSFNIQGYEIDASDFNDYVQSVWTIMNQAKKDHKFPDGLRKLLLKGLKGCNVHSPTFLEMFENLLHDIEFSPACAKKIEMYPAPDFNKLPTFDIPPTSPLLLKSALIASGKYPQFNQGFLRPAYSRFGRRCYEVAGRSQKAYKKQITKLNANIVAPEENMAPELHLEMIKLLEVFGIRRHSLEFQIHWDKLEQALMKETSIGYLPVEFLEVVGSGVQKATGLKKKDIAPIAIKMFQDWVDSLTEWIDGNRSGPPPKVSFVDVEMLKYEITWCHDVVENPNITREEIDDSLEKVRLFYMANILDYMLANVCYKHVSETVRFYESAIGVRVEAGGLQKIWEILGHVDRRPDQQAIIDKWLARGIDLRVMKYGQGDWSKYDQTLLAIVLAFVSIFAYPFFNIEKSGMSPEVIKAMFLQFVVSNVQKIMYVYAHGLFEVFGCMFSGKFMTSIGDTIYQMLLKAVYFQRLLRKYPNNELLQDIIQFCFIIFFFYGDDHLASWPKVLDDLGIFLYEESDCILKDFILFCTKVFGMNHKEKEFKVFDNLYARNFFTLVDGVFVEDLDLQVEGPTFLKNQVSEVFIRTSTEDEYIFVDHLPYRPTVDIACKMTVTVKSSGNVKTAAMSLMSFARLCTGNLEAYCMVKALYDEIAPLAGEITWEDWDYFKNTVGENSARRVAKNGSFPSYDSLVHDQRTGKDQVGFIPKDLKGRPAPTSDLYTATGMGNAQVEHFDTTDVFYDDKDLLERMADAYNNFDQFNVGEDPFAHL